MGFTTGLLGGVTLTTTILYLSLTVHNRNRLRQSALLQQQAQVLHTITTPELELSDRAPREVQVGLVEAAKDRWNAQVEREVRMLQNIDWRDVWERVEEGISAVYRKGFEKGREVAEDVAKKS